MPGCQAAVTEARPLPVIINPFAALTPSSHLVLSGAAPFSAQLGDWERLLFQLGVGRWENERQWSETWRKEGARTQPEGGHHITLGSGVWTGVACGHRALWRGAEGAKWVSRAGSCLTPLQKEKQIEQDLLPHGQHAFPQG